MGVGSTVHSTRESVYVQRVGRCIKKKKGGKSGIASKIRQCGRTYSSWDRCKEENSSF